MTDGIGIEVNNGVIIIRTTKGRILTPSLSPVPTRLLEALVAAYPNFIRRDRLEYIAYGDDKTKWPKPGTLRVHMNKVRKVVLLHGGYLLQGVQMKGYAIVSVSEKLKNDLT